MKISELNDMDEKPKCEIKGCEEDGFGLIQKGPREFLVLCPSHYKEIRMMELQENEIELENRLKTIGLELDD